MARTGTSLIWEAQVFALRITWNSKSKSPTSLNLSSETLRADEDTAIQRTGNCTLFTLPCIVHRSASPL